MSYSPGMERSTGPEVTFDAPPPARSVHLDGDERGVARAEATEALAAVLGHPAAVLLTGSCSAALEAAAAGLGLAPGDEVVVPAYTFPTSATAFLARGATVRFADADLMTGNVDPSDVARVIGPRTRAVVAMHYGGVAADMAGLTGLLDGRGIDLIEDAAQGIFASADGVALGRAGRYGTISFHRTKNVSTLDGGALVVNDPADVEAAHVAVDQGTNRRAFVAGRVPAYEWSGPGSAWRMPEAALRLLPGALVEAEQTQHLRHAVWSRYAHELASWAVGHGVGLPVVPDGRRHPAHLFFLVLPDGVERGGFVERCAAAGVQVVRHYGSLPASTYGATLAHPDDRCPNAAVLGQRLVRLPLHPELAPTEVDRVLEVVTSAL